MKELTIEEKAKAYDEAIAHAKTLLKTIGNATLGNLVLKNEFENMFPELKESREDEMIRIIKEVILNSVPYKENILTKDTTITAEEAIAWLEKQDEDKVKPKFKAGDIIRWKKAGSIEYTIKEICDKGYINTADGIMNISQTDIEFELVEQKPKWSEEDEELCEHLIKGIEELDPLPTSIYSDCKKWLKSLKGRYICKPSDEHYELEEFAKIVRCNLTGISKAVQKLFEAKYLQLTGNKMYGGFKD